MRALFVLAFIAAFFTGTYSDEETLEKIRSLNRVKRVIGGAKVEKGQWPWLVHLKAKVPSRFFWGWPIAYKEYYCGGSVINKRWILTAAHCFTKKGSPSGIMTPKYWHAKVGEIEQQHDFSARLKSIAGRLFGYSSWVMWYVHADKIILNPNYDADNGWQNDIALIRLEKELPVDSNSNIGPVILPEQSIADWPADNEECIFKGWGCTHNGGGITNRAQSISMPKVQDGICIGVFGVLDLTTRLCAGHVQQSKGICAGDSGGPLVCKKGDEWHQAGVASFTSSNRPGQVPGVFTRVSAFSNWIKETTKL